MTQLDPLQLVVSAEVRPLPGQVAQDCLSREQPESSPRDRDDTLMETAMERWRPSDGGTDRCRQISAQDRQLDPKPKPPTRGPWRKRDTTIPHVPRHRATSDAEQLYVASIRGHYLLTASEEFELAQDLEAVEILLWKRLIEGPLVFEAQQRLLELETPLVLSSPDAARAADLDRGIITRLLGSLPPAADETFEQELQALQELFMKATRIRARFVSCNLRLVLSTIRRYGYHLNTPLPLGDLIQEGNLGLIKAVPRYDYRRGLRFCTFATWWIRHCIVDARQTFSVEVRVPVHLQDLASKVRQVKDKFQRERHRDPSLAELSQETNVSKKRLKALEHGWLKHPEALPLFDSSGEEGSRNVLLPSKDPRADEILVGQQKDAHIAAAVKRMPPLLAQIVRRRFGLEGDKPETLFQIGDSLHLSRERIRQLEKKALDILRRRLVKLVT